MSVKIRLAKFGKRHAPSYRVVVTHTRTKRNGKYLEIIGHFNPSDPTKDLVLDKEKYDEWVKKGAQQTEAVKKLYDGTYEYKKYEPKKTGTEEDSKKQEQTNEQPEESETEEEQKKEENQE